eukprot:1147169-Pelagomonas_calceolata.AAC.2
MKRVFWPLVPEYRDATHILHLNLIQDTSTAVVAGTNERGSSREAVPKGYFQENKHSRLLRHPQCTLEVEGVQVLEGGLPVPKTFTCSPHPVGNLQVFYYVPSEWKDAFQDEHRAGTAFTAVRTCMDLANSMHWGHDTPKTLRGNRATAQSPHFLPYAVNACMEMQFCFQVHGIVDVGIKAKGVNGQECPLVGPALPVAVLPVPLGERCNVDAWHHDGCSSYYWGGKAR